MQEVSVYPKSSRLTAPISQDMQPHNSKTKPKTSKNIDKQDNSVPLIEISLNSKQSFHMKQISCLFCNNTNIGEHKVISMCSQCYICKMKKKKRKEKKNLIIAYPLASVQYFLFMILSNPAFEQFQSNIKGFLDTPWSTYIKVTVIMTYNSYFLMCSSKNLADCKACQKYRIQYSW